MNTSLVIAAMLSLVMATTHSIMGEKYFLPRLYKPVLPFHLGTELFINRTLRTAWHFISLAWGFAAILLLFFAAEPLDETARWVCYVLVIWYGASALLSFVISRARHFSWVVLLAIALFTALGTLG
ncbi:MAG: hypothetical protein GXO78_06195 [Calditrichaeota bacterium]|nr:hypothetical protein [Calditrichota bacterium]